MLFSVFCGYAFCFYFFFIQLGETFGKPISFGPSARSLLAALPLRRAFIACDLGHGLAAQDGGVVLVYVESGRDVFIMFLYQQPLGAFTARAPRLDMDEREVAVEALAMQPKLEIALL